VLEIAPRTLPGADVPEATSEHSREGSGTEHGHPGTQRASHFVRGRDPAVTTHPTQRGWRGRPQQLSPPC